MAWTTLCRLDELAEGHAKYVAVGHHQLAVFLHVGKPYALDNRCPHAGGSLSGGVAEEGWAVCPWHQWRFRLDTGELRNAPRVRLGAYPTRIIEKDSARLVEADLPARPQPQVDPFELDEPAGP